MVYYALMAKDTDLLTLVDRSMATHLEFMLPDGAWDNSWGTRSFKWTYWGGRTSDGFMGGYYAMAAQHPEYLEAIHRNIQLLKRLLPKVCFMVACIIGFPGLPHAFTIHSVTLRQSLLFRTSSPEYHFFPRASA